MFTSLSRLHRRQDHRALRKALVNCSALALGTALACAGSASAGAATQPHPAKPGSLRLFMNPPSAKAGALPADIGNIQISNGYDGQCLDAENDSGGNPNDNGDKVQLWTCNSGATQQRWNIGTTGTITSQYGNHLCLDAETDSGGNPDDNGDKVQMWTCNSGAPQQKWTLEEVSDGTLAFINQYDTSTLIVLAAENDDGGGASQCGDNVQVQSWIGETQQTWNAGATSTGCS